MAKLVLYSDVENFSGACEQSLKKYSITTIINPNSIPQDADYLIIISLISMPSEEILSLYDSFPKKKIIVVNYQYAESLSHPAVLLLSPLIFDNQPLVIYQDSQYSYFTKLEGAVPIIIRQLFSYKLSSSLLLYSQSLKETFNSLPNFHNFQITTKPLSLPNNIQVLSLKSTLNSFPESKPSPVSSSPMPPLKKNISFKKYTKPFSYFLLIATWLFIFPFLILISSIITTYLAFNNLKSLNYSRAQNFLTYAHYQSQISKTGINLFSHFPLISTHLEYLSGTVSIYDQSLLLANKSIPTLQALEQNFNYLLGISSNISDKSPQTLAVELRSLNEDLQFINANLKAYSINSEITTKVGEISKLSEGISSLLANWDKLTGEEGPVQYLVLFQNNAELRPTGGFIGSFGLATFENSKYISTNIYDVYSADGQLLGYIKPPDPIQNILGEASWKMRDANWDPDFPKSAKRLEWFLDKSMDQDVNGVIALNLNFIQDLLIITGPIKLYDFDNEINSENFYQKIQSEVENDFFPGSRKKSSYLTAFANGLIAKLKTLNSSQKLALLRVIDQNLASQEIQIYHNDYSINNTIQVLGWSGSLVPSNCEINSCIEHWHAINESNLGVNKVNQFIERQSQYYLDITDNKISSSLNLKIINTSPHDPYLNYLRLYLPPSSHFNSATLTQKGNSDQLKAKINSSNNFQEVGINLNIDPSEEIVLTLNWFQDLPAQFPQQIIISAQKQSGVKAYPLSFWINSNTSQPLTKTPTQGYNTFLSTDQLIKLNYN